MTRLWLAIRLVTVLITCALPAITSAQPWLEAYQAGQYSKAANLLHEIVSDQDKVLRGGDLGRFASSRRYTRMAWGCRAIPSGPVR